MVELGDGYTLVTIQGAVGDKRISRQMESQVEHFEHIDSMTLRDGIVRGELSRIVKIEHGRIRKALMKSYMALAYYAGIDPRVCNISIPYLRGIRSEAILQEPPVFLFHDRSARYNHISLIYSMDKFLLGGAHISAFPSDLLTRGQSNNESYSESLVPALLSTQYDGPPIMKAYMVNLKDRQHNVLDIRCLLDDGTVKFNPRQPK